ncbi:MAG: endonuclease/exonuclease/phosphatase family protein [Flavobacteriales bacterium]|nr:endonuclease/exonuclease/phosphatase family protein [Flavobacteriales bacterium]
MKKILNNVLFVINIILLFTLVISYISPFVNPSHIWPLAFSGLFFPIILFVNLLCLIYWIFFNKKFMIINIVILLFSLPYLSRYISFHNTTKTKQNSIKIMSYNVRLFNAWRWINDEDIDDKIIDFVHTENVDILCIQEYYNPNEKLKFDFKYSTIDLEGSKENLHMVIYSNYEIINDTINSEMEDISNTCIFSDIIIKTDTIRVYNIHLTSNLFSRNDIDFLKSPILEKEKVKNGIVGITRRLKRSFVKRSEQVKEIKKHMENSPYPIVVCGDFNDTPVSYVYRELSEGKTDAFINSGNGIGSTYTKIPTLRIDYIFHEKEVNSYNYKTHSEELSDHRAISCELTFD